MYASEFRGLTDIAVARRAMAGDSEAFEELADRFGPVARAIAAATVGYPMADDIAQDVLLMARRGVRALRRPEHFAAWLRTVTRRRALEVAKRDRRVSAEAFADELRYHESLTVVRTPAEIVAKAADNAALHRAMRRLPSALADSLRMQYWHGVPQRRIATALGVSLPTVKWRVREAKLRLRAMLTEWKESDDG